MFKSLLEIHGSIMDAERIPYLIIAILATIVIGMIIGPVAGNANSLFYGLFDILFGKMGDRMDRLNRSKSDLVFRGFLFSSFIMFFSLVLASCSEIIKSHIYEILVIASCLTSGTVWYILLKLYFALKMQGKCEGAYYGLSRSSRVDLNSTDDFGITRVALGFSANSFDKGVVAPSIWYLIGGIPLLFVYCSISFVAWRFGKKGFSKGFGTIALALEKIVGFIPSLFAGFIFSAAAALTPTAKLHKALLSWWAKKGKAPYEQGGIVLSAIAWPLDISIGGPVQDISGSTLKGAWIGPEGATAQISYEHLKRGILINVYAHILFILALLTAYVYSGHFF